MNNNVTKHIKWPINKRKGAQFHPSGKKKHINPTIQYYHKTSITAKIMKTDNVGKDMEPGKLPDAAGWSYIGTTTLETVWDYLLKLTLHTSYKLAVPLPDRDQIKTFSHRFHETCTKVTRATLSIMPPKGPPKGSPTIHKCGYINRTTSV